MQFVFPSDPMNPKKIDAYFKPQAEAFTSIFGGHYGLFSLEKTQLYWVQSLETLVYRGWMLDFSQYLLFEIEATHNHATPFTDIRQYFNTHHIPNWYPLLKRFTPETFVIENEWIKNGCDVVAEIQRLGWGKFILKDYVKSLKTAGGSVITEAEDAPRVMELMEKYRGSIEGGLCIRRYEELHGEQRAFIIDREPHWRTPSNRLEAALLYMIAENIDSPFFSVDFAYNEKDELRIVELGDGQVSDLTGDWLPLGLAEVFHSSVRRKGTTHV